MESELSGIFRVKLVTKNIVRGSPGTQFMHMRVNINPNHEKTHIQASAASNMEVFETLLNRFQPHC